MKPHKHKTKIFRKRRYTHTSGWSEVYKCTNTSQGALYASAGGDTQRRRLAWPKQRLEWRPRGPGTDPGRARCQAVVEASTPPQEQPSRIIASRRRPLSSSSYSSPHGPQATARNRSLLVVMITPTVVTVEKNAPINAVTPRVNERALFMFSVEQLLASLDPVHVLLTACCCCCRLHSSSGMLLVRSLVGCLCEDLVRSPIGLFEGGCGFVSG